MNENKGSPGTMGSKADDMDACRNGENKAHMSNRQWKALIADQFGVSKSVANKMLHSMYETKKICQT